MTSDYLFLLSLLSITLSPVSCTQCPQEPILLRQVVVVAVAVVETVVVDVDVVVVVVVVAVAVETEVVSAVAGTVVVFVVAVAVNVVAGVAVEAAIAVAVVEVEVNEVEVVEAEAEIAVAVVEVETVASAVVIEAAAGLLVFLVLLVGLLLEVRSMLALPLLSLPPTSRLLASYAPHMGARGRQLGCIAITSPLSLIRG